MPRTAERMQFDSCAQMHSFRLIENTIRTSRVCLRVTLTVGNGTSGAGGLTQNDAAQSLVNIDSGNLPSFSDLFALFQIAPQEFDATDDIQLAGDPPGIGHYGGPSLAPPEIPDQRPLLRIDRVDFLKDAATWLGQVGKASIVGQLFLGATNNVEWLNDYQHIIQTYNDPPKTFEELQGDVANPEKGYQIHHILWSRQPPRNGG
jgi:hypothetical protein